MGKIKEVKIKGYKKFENFHVKFGDGVNILIGENSVGKSTIVEAIEIVLDQIMFKYDTTQLDSLLNNNNVETFNRSKDHLISELPKIEIEIFLDIPDNPNNAYFYGEHYDEFNDKQDLCYGIKFIFEFDNEFEQNFQEIDFNNGIQPIPLEYYISKWETFAGNPYKSQRNPLKSILIDNSNYVRDIYGSYAKKIYGIQLDEQLQRELSFSFKGMLTQALQDRELDLTVGNQILQVDTSKAQLKNLLEVSENGVLLKNMGKGKESLIKTELSLSTKSQLVLIEEPENHLSYLNTRKMIENIQNKSSVANQIILTTHESMILNRLNLSRAIWITKQEGKQLKNLPIEDTKFFEKNDDFNILKFVLANKIILVEGATEFILLPSLIKRLYGKSIDELGLIVISLQGIHYKHFIKLSQDLNKRTLVLTDNDGTKSDEISLLNKELSIGDNMHIAVPVDDSEFKLEVALYNLNKKMFEDITPSRANSTTFKSHEDLDIPLAYSLRNKTDTVMKIVDKIESGEEFMCPSYIKEGIKWVLK